jgi:hypothetical protein
VSEHQGLPVAGYRPQSTHNVERVNENKALEEQLLRRLDDFKHLTNIDQRWLAIARTHFEEGFMALNRSIFKPGRVALPGEDA